MKLPIPIQTLPLFPRLDQKLIELLRSLSASDWEKPTVASRWTVKDIAAHLLDGNLRALSMLRDNYYGQAPDPIHSYQDLVSYLNRLNAEWVLALKRLSPPVLTELLESTGKPYYDYLKTLNPFDPATFSVAWAGEQESENWFHLAREYTEKWHHQQQIRLAVGQEGVLYAREYYFPYLDTSMRALPHHYREVPGQEGALIHFHVQGQGGGDWFLYHDGQRWTLVLESTLPPACRVSIEGTVAWRIFTKGIRRADAEKYVTLTGNQALGQPIFDMLAVMA
ncbi:maleylpyruvate isomerase family mycothiol-dependent enzyme [Rhabdobacter roseus]|uniref:Uncharacterized protein (TIGR03083 family) n=1 Tax=Rhabdobacter roseus TaxID=1655419 RepID=A0A840TPJ6_9BACT|nr:maleylpyruvate isomerase N-terminal domain-containing protein [Rhabdobacter roseus]MBB5283657.1 uncharacterized protein (TIGR03083 family) [Rhabdobacter roseus]